MQKKAVEFAAGAMQVLAGPGSGKTFTIVNRIQYLIEHYGVDSPSILVITFTRAAAEEMRQRFNKQVRGKKPLVNFGTFHAIFYHILRQTGQYRKYTLITEPEKRKLLSQLLQMPASLLLTGNERIDVLIQAISQMKNNGKNVDKIPLDLFSKEEFLGIYREYNEYLAEFWKLDFDDMGLMCLKLFQKNPDILAQWQEKYQYILVDEFQDINQMQYQIIRYIAAPQDNLFVVGDDDQSIYGFRGARPDIMRQFMEDYPNAGQLFLDVNYRSHKQIVAKSMKVIGANTNRFEKKIKAVHQDGDGVRMKSFSGQDKEYETLIQELKELTLKKKPELLNNTAVIYRTNYECGRLAEKLLLHDIPFVMKEPLRSQYDHFVVKDLLAYLEFAYGNRNRDIFHLFMNRPLRYFRKDCARHNPVVLKELITYYHNEPIMQETAGKLFDEIEQISKMRPYLAVNYIRQVIGYDDYLRETYGTEMVEKLLRIADDFQKLSKKYRNFKDLNDYIGQCRKQVAAKLEEADTEQEKKKKQNGIRILTMHAAKGLEFETVYLPDVNEGKIPMKQAVSKEAVEEERRMFYVAMTRAKKNLHIFYCRQKQGKDAPSRFLEPILPKS